MRLARPSLDGVIRFLWALVLLTLPVTSFRYFPFLGRSTQVRPLAAYPLALLLPLLLFRWLRRRTDRLPDSLTLFGAFLAVALAMTALGALYAPPELRGQTYWGRALRAWVTVGLGTAFFLAAIWMNRDEADIRFSLRWLFLGFAVDVLWSGVQAVTFYTPLLEKRVVTMWQLAFSIRELVGTNRVSGMAFEPAWLAGQIATLYLPWLVAAILARYSFGRHRSYLPLLLLVVAFGLLLMTYSRGGLFITLLATGLTTLFTGREDMARVWEWFVSAFRDGEAPLNRKLLGWTLRLGVIILILSTAVGVFLFLGQKGYFSRLWSTSADSLLDYIIANHAGARTAYAVSATRIFLTHPWTGVGLGASGFYMYGNLPEWALTRLPEIAWHLDPGARLFPNPKNIYLRLLAETGLSGFIIFLTFYLAILSDILSVLHSSQENAFRRFLGVAGLFTWLAVGMLNLTQDSLAIPRMWINLGMVIGVARTWMRKRPPTGTSRTEMA